MVTSVECSHQELSGQGSIPAGTRLNFSDCLEINESLNQGSELPVWDMYVIMYSKFSTLIIIELVDMEYDHQLELSRYRKSNKCN